MCNTSLINSSNNYYYLSLTCCIFVVVVWNGSMKRNAFRCPRYFGIDCKFFSFNFFLVVFFFFCLFFSRVVVVTSTSTTTTTNYDIYIYRWPFKSSANLSCNNSFFTFVKCWQTSIIENCYHLFLVTP